MHGCVRCCSYLSEAALDLLQEPLSCCLQKYVINRYDVQDLHSPLRKTFLSKHGPTREFEPNEMGELPKDPEMVSR